MINNIEITENAQVHIASILKNDNAKLSLIEFVDLKISKNDSDDIPKDVTDAAETEKK